jgi:AraC-like DNA-binding protein
MTVSAPFVRVLVELVEESGVSGDEFFRRSGFDAERLAECTERFDLNEFERLEAIAVELTKNEALALHFAERASEPAFGLVGHLISHAPTLREAIALSARFGSILCGEFRLTLQEKVDVASLRYDFKRSSPRHDRMRAEFAMTGFLRLLRLFAGPRAAARTVFFEHAAPPHRREYQRVFGGSERFSQPFTGVEFDREWLDRKQLHQHAALYYLLRAEAERTLEQIEDGGGTADRLRQYLCLRPPAQMPSMESAAGALGMSVRSLRRRLSDDGASYRGLVQGIQEDAAIHALKNPERSLQDAANAAGFADPAAFQRAFKRWTGMTPTEFRQPSKRVRTPRAKSMR